MAAKVIYDKRAQLQGFLNPWNESPFLAVVVKEEVTVTRADKADNNPTAVGDGEPVAFQDEIQPSNFVNIEVAARSPSTKMPAVFNVPGVAREVAINEKNAEAWLYARVAFLFFFALGITWIPSSVNRIYDLATSDNPSFVLNYFSSLVFPLQGFWNVIVYIVTSRTACKQLWNSMLGRGNIRANMRANKAIKIDSPRAISFASRGRSRKGAFEIEEGEMNRESIHMKKMSSGRQRFGSQGSSVGGLTQMESGG
jgi:hypothetical protein